MIKPLLNIRSGLLLLPLFFIFTGCSDKSEVSKGITVGTGTVQEATDGPGTTANTPVEQTGDGIANLTMSVTDAPIDDAESVNVTIRKIDIKKGPCGEVSETCDASGDACEFETYFDAADASGEQSIDLLKFRNGASYLFETVPLAVGEYCQVRLYLSENSGANTIVLTDSGESKNLEINSGIRNNGLKLVSEFELVDGQESSLTLDFDVRKSIVVKGGTKKPRYALKPTIRVIQTDQSGNLSLTSEIVTEEGQVFYLYEQDFDVTNEASATVVDNMGTDATSDDETVSMPFANAVSSAVADKNLKAVFVAIPFGSYDLYSLDAGGESLTLVQAGIAIPVE